MVSLRIDEALAGVHPIRRPHSGRLIHVSWIQTDRVRR